MNVEASQESIVTLKLDGHTHKLTFSQAGNVIRVLQEQLGQSFVGRVKREVGNAYNFTVAQIESHERVNRLCLARFICYKLLREHGMSYSEIGAEFGGRDHSGIVSGLNSLEDRISLQAPLRAEIDLLRQRVGI